ncbi:MAG: hypothetical protein ACR2P1_06085 [Pseudomonadales bacterium]
MPRYLLDFKHHIVMLVTAILLTACGITRTPIPSLSYPGSEAAQTQSGKKLLVVLRGMGGSEKSFEKHGFIAALQKQYPEFDVVAPNAHFGYYRKRSITQRLSVDIIDPAIAVGYEEIWLAGVSLGGFGNLVYLRCCETKITGVVLISPFSGKKNLHDDVNAYLDGKQGPPWVGTNKSEDSIMGIWRWLIENREILGGGRVWLGYGNEDRLSGHDLLARLIPDDQVVKLSGGHKVEVFMRIWREILSRDPMSAQ